MPQMEKFLEQHRKEEKTKKEEKERLKVAAAKQEDGAADEKKEDADKTADSEGVDTFGKEHPRDEEEEADSPAKKQKLDE